MIVGKDNRFNFHPARFIRRLPKYSFARARIRSTRKISFVGLAIIVTSGWIASGRAASLPDYRHRISEAIRAMDQLDRARDQTSANLVLARLRAELPKSETVFLTGQSVAVDNSWLHESLDKYEKIGSAGSRRHELLARIRERLLALSEASQNFEKASGESTKDQDKARLAGILRRPEYNKAAPEASALERLWTRFVRWLLSLLPNSPALRPGNARSLSSLAQVVVVVVGLALIVFFLWKFGPRLLRNRKEKKGKREARIVLGERLEPDQTSADLLAQAENLARSGDLRAAIRKAYIAFLCELADRKMISLAQHKTNRDYLSSVRDRAPLYASMRELTNSFEIHWYGLEPAGENDWNEFRSGYLHALKIS